MFVKVIVKFGITKRKNQKQTDITRLPGRPHWGDPFQFCHAELSCGHNSPAAKPHIWAGRGFGV